MASDTGPGGSTAATKTGSCLCGAVSYWTDGPLRPVVLCHCSQCRRTSGHFFAATQTPSDQLEISGRDKLTWYGSSEQARRAFCSICGSQLFWERHGSGMTSILAGSLDQPTGLHVQGQIHVEDKADYYALPDVPIIERGY